MCYSSYHAAPNLWWRFRIGQALRIALFIFVHLNIMYGRADSLSAQIPQRPTPQTNVKAGPKQQSLACEDSNLQLSCGSGEVISILEANYGRTTGREVCPHATIPDLNCHASNSLNILRAQCDGESSCAVPATNEVFGDPCRGTYKYLEVAYACSGPLQCRQPEVASTVTFDPQQDVYANGSLVTFSCQLGLALVPAQGGGITSRCLGGEWIPDPAECYVTPSSCSRPDVPDTTLVTPDQRTYKDRTTIVLECGRDAFTAVCENGQWDSIPSVCEVMPVAPDVNNDIAILLQDSNSTVDAKLNKLVNLTRQSDQLTAETVKLVVDFLENITAIGTANQEVTNNFVETLGNLIGVPKTELLDAQRNANATNRALDILAKQLDIVDTSLTNGTFSASHKHLDVLVIDVAAFQYLNGLTFAAHDDDRTEVYFNMTTITDELNNRGINASIILSGLPGYDLVNHSLDPTADLRLSFTVHKLASLFVSLTLAEFNDGLDAYRRGRKFDREPATPVVSAAVRNKSRDTLDHPVITAFPVDKTNGAYKNPQCVMWDFAANNMSGDWSSDGCRMQRDSMPGMHVCQCRRLGNFAILFDVYDGTFLPIEIQRFMWVLTYVGCSLSTFGLILTTIAYASSKKLRSKQPNQILLCLMASLLGLNITLLVAMTILDHVTGLLVPCSLQGALLHFFTLSSLCWMGVEGLNVYLLLVRVVNAYIPRFVQRAAIVGWGVPALLVAFLIALFREDYVQLQTCFLQPWPHIIGLLIPAGLIIVFNFAAFVRVVRSLNRRRPVSTLSTSSTGKETSARHRDRLRRLRSAFIIMVLLGLTWVFGLLGNIPDPVVVSVFQTLFTLLNAFQGFIIFIMYCIQQPPARKQLSDVFMRFCFCTKIDLRTMSTSSSSSADQNRNKNKAVTASASRAEQENCQATKTTAPRDIHL